MAKYQKEKITLLQKFGVLRYNQIILLWLLLLGCQSRDIRPKVTGTEYFPLKVNAFWIYTVSETTITQLGGQTNTGYELKVQAIDSVVSGGQVTYAWVRFTRTDSSKPWISLDTWSSRKDEFQAVVQEGNTSYIRLAFPLVDGKTWNGNALNNLGGSDQCANGSFHCDNFEVKDFMKRFEGSGISFADTATILENNSNDPIVKQDVRMAVYAKSIGLVYRETTILEYCTVGSCIGKQIVENGSIMKQTLKEYGGI